MNPSNGDSFLQAYLDANKTLVKTMCIKSATSAQTINDRLIQLYGESSVDKGTPSSWKYYLNISGEYHATDTIMMVTSLDTLEEISFTKENLVLHSATAAAYQYGSSRYFYSLLSKYPAQEQLMLGILNPVDINKAIAAEDGAILGYPKSLVEPQEQTLMIDLEDFIQRHMARWNVQAYGLVDSLYNTSYHAVLYLTLLPKLLNLRLARCKTNEAHTFHIRQYLASHGKLDKYIPYLTLKQCLYFYRNISYIERNKGKAISRDTLIKNILTDRQISLAEYSIRHLNTFDEYHYPEVRARRKPINGKFNVGEKSYISTSELYNKEDRLVYGNFRYRAIAKESDNKLFKNSYSSVVQTKNLESDMVDYSDAVPETLEAVLLKQWAYMASNDLYNVVITFKDPKTGEDRNLYAKDALIYYIYVMFKSYGVDLQTVPSFLIERFRLPNKPSIEQLVSKAGVTSKKLTAIATDLWLNQPAIQPCYSSSMFFNTTYKIYEEALNHWRLIGNTHELSERAQVESMVLQMYGDKFNPLAEENTSIDDWLIRNNLPPYTYTYNQAVELSNNIYTSATGLYIDETKLLKNIQKNMINLLSDLSSYTLLFIREVNDSEIKLLNWAAIRLGNNSTKAAHSAFLETNIRINDGHSKTVTKANLPAEFVKLKLSGASLLKTVAGHTSLAIVSEYKVKESASYAIPGPYIKASYAEYDPAVSSQTSLIGIELFNSLTETQKKSIKTFYS